VKKLIIEIERVVSKRVIKNTVTAMTIVGVILRELKFLLERELRLLKTEIFKK
jgi:hypothetical protein